MADAQIDSKDLEVVQKLNTSYRQIKAELSKVIVGQEHVVDELLIAIFARGHCMLEGVPGLAKTLLISTLSDTLNLKFNRIQFTPDLMPSDITGTEVIQENKATGAREFKFLPGPLFANVILADEINRTPPKTQAALLEAMQEYQVTVGGNTYNLDTPFFVLATQNPIEQEGTYPLPMVQQDRFMFSIIIGYLPRGDEAKVVAQTTSQKVPKLDCKVSRQELMNFQAIVREIPAADVMVRYAVRLASWSRPDHPKAPDFVKEYVSWGASPRASHYLILAAKTRAALAGRLAVSLDDIRAVAVPVLRHRIMTNFRAESAGMRSEQIVDKLMKTVPAPSSGLG